ncbi:protoporphyrinogen/coproporphyrinogen oxidase [Plantibacter sp. RU18]|uniref:protoporphyrinogen/coproporphyrinogen oxidase n=1 Tax=Plantibacter sp. RU18 TaxID=3158143 RepID=UPI003D36CCDA
MSLTPKRVVVIGGGIAGLVGAIDCAKVGIDVTVVESAQSFGGAVAAAEVAGLLVDVGAESFATRGGSVAELIEQLGITDCVVRPNRAGAWLHIAKPGQAARTVPLPKAGLLGIPTNPLADDVRRVIGWTGSLRAYLDRIRPPLTIGAEHNLGTLVRKRMGSAVHDLLVAPVTSGVYSAMPEDLDVDRAAPGLNAALTRTGALSLAVSALRESAPAGAAVGGLDGGMTVLVDALVAELEHRASTLITGVAVSAISREPFDIDIDTDAEGVGLGDAGLPRMSERRADPDSRRATGPQPAWYIALTDGRVLEADLVLVATPERQARNLLADVGPALRDLPAAGDDAGDPVLPAPIELATIVLDEPALDAAPRGSGLLVAPGSTLHAKALTHATAKWGWLAARAKEQGEHRHVIRLSFGRQGEADATSGLSDEELLAVALTDASVMLGVELDPASVRGFHRVSWTGTQPTAARGHRERSAIIREAVAEVPDLAVTGAWLSGTGLASVVPDAHEAAARLRHQALQL